MYARTALSAALATTALLVQPGLARAAAEPAKESYEETIDQTFALNTAGSVTLGNRNGSIEVTVWDKPEVHIVAVKRMRLDDGDWWLARLIGLKTTTVKTDAEARALFENLRVEFSGDDAGRTVTTHYPDAKNINFQVAYTVTVPKSAKLDLDTVNGRVEVSGAQSDIALKTTSGSIHVADTRGPLRAETTNGRVRLENVSGPIVAETTNGSVDCGIAPGAPLSEITLGSVNGSVRLRVPADARFELEARTVNGSVACSLPLAKVASQSRKRLEASIGDSGPRVQLSTTNGSIRIDPI